VPDDRQGSPQDGQNPSSRPFQGANGAGRNPRAHDPMPPPAFPPGQLGPLRPRFRGRSGAGDGVPDDAFISPDEPIERSGSRIAPGAFISPDAPLPTRGEEDEDIEPGQGIVTGMGDDPHLGAEDLAIVRQSDPVIADLALRIRRLADALLDKGEAGLRTTPEMSRFEATLRAYCVGYLAGQREIRPE